MLADKRTRPGKSSSNTALRRCGFARIYFGRDKAVELDTGFHYLHHKYFECNYGILALPVLDTWLRTFHDGSEAAHARLMECAARRRIVQRG